MDALLVDGLYNENPIHAPNVPGQALDNVITGYAVPVATTSFNKMLTYPDCAGVKLYNQSCPP
jgi:hypothetical protein